MKEPVVTKKSPIVIVRNFIALQFASGGLYIFAGSMAYYAQIWRAHDIERLIPFQAAQLVFMFAIELILILYIFVSWSRQTVTIGDGQLTLDQGIIFRRHTIISLDRVASATFTQSVLGKLTSYGTVSIHDATGAVLLKLGGLPDPRQFIDKLTLHKGSEVSPDVDPAMLATTDEHERLERKSTLRWDLNAGKVNKALERASMKTVAAFLNSEGGHLVLGVADDRNVLGLEHDYATLAGHKDADGLANHFGNLFNAMLGAHVRHLVRLQPFSIQGKECMLVSVAPSQQPVYLSQDGTEEFFVRTGNGTTSLKLSEATAYIATRFK